MTAWYRGRLGLILVAALQLAAPAPARADVVLDWNVIAVNTAAPLPPAVGQNPFFQARTAAIVQLAVFEAVNAITGDYQGYLDTDFLPADISPAALASASAEAAAVAAAHTALKTLFPASAAALDAARATSLASIPGGTTKDDGVKIGEAAAKAMTALRAADGSMPLQFYAPGPPTPGLWQTTPGCPIDPVTNLPVGSLLQWRNVTPFGIARAADFIPGPPPALTSNAYRKDYNEVKNVGSLNSEQRPQDRTDVARFYGMGVRSSPTALLGSAVRQISTSRGDSLVENARALALLNMAINDALVVSFATKYRYVLWRPETAIRALDDGNGRTEPLPEFMPFIQTPCFPSYPSNHASGTGAGAEMLRRLYGAGGHDITLTNPAVPVTLHYTTFNQIIDDVDDARVYGGIHFRFDQDAGNRIAREVATEVYKNNLRPVHGRE
jgi:hypothetical protein